VSNRFAGASDVTAISCGATISSTVPAGRSVTFPRNFSRAASGTGGYSPLRSGPCCALSPVQHSTQHSNPITGRRSSL
jgi:hypothetical protein